MDEARPRPPTSARARAVAWVVGALALTVVAAATGARGEPVAGSSDDWIRTAEAAGAVPTSPDGATATPTGAGSAGWPGGAATGSGDGTAGGLGTGHGAPGGTGAGVTSADDVGGSGSTGAAEPSGDEATPASDPATPPTTSPDQPAIVARPIPDAPAATTPPPAQPSWAASVQTTSAGYLTTDLGCAAGLDAPSLDAFFADRVGPLIGEDYQHVVALGDDRFLWLFQDAFVDQGGGAQRLDQASFVHNVALVQAGACFTLLHRGSVAAPASFEPGDGEQTLDHWYWPMGGETSGGRVHQFWVRMVKDGVDPGPGDGLGWHPDGVWLAEYDASTLERLSFAPAAASGVTPIYGYTVASDEQYTYLFGNTFEQNLTREGGLANGPHSATGVFLARVPLGQYGAAPEYRTGDGWSPDAAAAVAVSSRYWVENPMQPRYLAGQWVAVAKVDGYWGEELSVDVASDPWGPWQNVAREPVLPRDGDPLMNTYHAHLMPWLDGGQLVVSISQNARDMRRDAFPHPVRYRPRFVTTPLVAPRTPGPAPTETAPPTSGDPTTTALPVAPTTTGASAPTSTSTSTPTSATASTTPVTGPPTPAPTTSNPSTSTSISSTSTSTATSSTSTTSTSSTTSTAPTTAPAGSSSTTTDAASSTTADPNPP